MKIKKPTLVIDEEKCRKNIRRMVLKADRSQVIFRPHFKTHQSATIGEWFRDEGVEKITVSSVTMADFFSRHGWNDITIAFPLNICEMQSVKKIAEKVKLNILTSGIGHLELINKQINFPAICFIKIDTGNRRAGVEWDDYPQVQRMLSIINKNKLLRISGFLLHSGHAYHARSSEAVMEVYYDTLKKCISLKENTGGNLIISTGDTPSCSIAENFKGFDEIRPGNFVFYDLMQEQISSCRREDIAVAVYCPVVDIYRKRNEVLIYGGAVHLSKDSVTIYDGRQVFGEVAFPGNNGWIFPEKRIFLKSLSQEHGIISVPEDMMSSFRIGDIVAIIPVHSCLTVDLLREYYTLNGRKIKDLSPK